MKLYVIMFIKIKLLLLPLLCSVVMYLLKDPGEEYFKQKLFNLPNSSFMDVYRMFTNSKLFLCLLFSFCTWHFVHYIIIEAYIKFKWIPFRCICMENVYLRKNIYQHNKRISQKISRCHQNLPLKKLSKQT